jgi:hypothetical protein
MFILGRLPYNDEVMCLLQELQNNLPSPLVSSSSSSSADAAGGDDDINNQISSLLQIEANDAAMNMYVGSVIRATLAMHNVILNKITARGLEKKMDDQAKANAAAAAAASGDVEENKKGKGNKKQNK